MKKNKLSIITALIVIILIATVTFSGKNNIINSLIFWSDGDIEEPVEPKEYEIEQVKLFAIALETESENIENFKSTPTTCRINVDKVTRIIYMDGEEKVGEQYAILNEPIGKLLEIDKEGYIFEMWTRANDEVVTEETIIETSTEDIILYANWNIIVSNLIVNPNQGTWNDSTGEQEFSMEYAEEKEIPDPTREGYTFMGWELTGKVSKIENKIFKMGIEDSSLTATWDANGYTITIDPNKGTYNGTIEPTKEGIAYDTTKTIEEPVRKGYTFTGWTVSAGTLNGKEFFMNYAGDVTLTANWVVNSYNYIVNHSQQSIDGSAFNKVADDTVTGTADFDTKLTPKVNTYTGFASPNSQTITIDVDVNPPEKNIVNYNYNRNRYTLTINPNTGLLNGSTSSISTQLYYEQTYGVSNPTKVGYNFRGWNNSDSNSKLVDQIFTMNLSNVTLTAIWEAKTYQLTYNVNGGNALSSNTKTLTYDASYGTLATPSRAGYRFLGWYTAASGGTLVTKDTMHRVEQNVTIYAHWENTPPDITSFTLAYTNSNQNSTQSGAHGLLKGNSEVGTLTVNTTDAQDGTGTTSVTCMSGKLCNSLQITKNSNTTFTLKATNFGVGLLKITTMDKAGLSDTEYQVMVVYGEGASTLVNAQFTNTTFDSGFLERVEGCYIKSFTFEVQFKDGHNNSSASDNMTVKGITQSGMTRTLFTWTGNMLATLHVSNTVELDNYNSTGDKIVQINFYTYSPHDSCAKTATIKYTVDYEFDIDLLEQL